MPLWGYVQFLYWPCVEHKVKL